MKAKYKYYIFLNVCVITAIVVTIGTWIALRNPENTYLIGAIAFTIHLIALTMINRLISKRARQDIEMNSKSN
jgi:uncharacterized membrane protein YkgB